MLILQAVFNNSKIQFESNSQQKAINEKNGQGCFQ